MPIIGPHREFNRILFLKTQPCGSWSALMPRNLRDALDPVRPSCAQRYAFESGLFPVCERRITSAQEDEARPTSKPTGARLRQTVQDHVARQFEAIGFSACSGVIAVGGSFTKPSRPHRASAWAKCRRAFAEGPALWWAHDRAVREHHRGLDLDRHGRDGLEPQDRACRSSCSARSRSPSDEPTPPNCAEARWSTNGSVRRAMGNAA